MKWFVFNVIFYCCGALSIILGLRFFSSAIDSLTLRSGIHVTGLLVLTLLCIVGYELFYRIGHIFEIIMQSHFRKNIKRALFAHISSLHFGYFADRFAGEIAHKITATTDAFERLSLIASNEFFEGGAVILVSAVSLAFVNIYYGLVILAWLVIFMIGYWPISKKMNQVAGDYAFSEAQTSGKLVDVYGNISSVKVYGKNKDANRINQQIDQETRAFQEMGKWDIITYNYEGILIILLSAALILVSAYLYSNHLVTLGAIIFVATVGLRLFNIGWELGRNVALFVRYRGEALQNLNDLIVAPSILDGLHSGAIQDRVGIEYRNVVFGYKDEITVLDNFSFHIRPNEKVGIVGLSGAGKTTFANLLLRFFDPQSGAILLNGIDIRNFTQEYLRSHVSYISQDTSLFHATIAENIAYGSQAASPADIEVAAELAYADDFIKSSPNGYQSVVGERGIKLSGGQRQRIAIARALLADRPLFLLDEATSALDSDSEEKIQKGLARLIEDKTVIAIAHRLSTLSHMDRIIFIENGKIVEDGTHQQLLAKNGRYAVLWRMQAGGFLPADLKEPSVDRATA